MLRSSSEDGRTIFEDYDAGHSKPSSTKKINREDKDFRAKVLKTCTVREGLYLPFVDYVLYVLSIKFDNIQNRLLKMLSKWN